MLIVGLNINVPLAEHYQSYASQLGIHFPSRRDQEMTGTGSTDQGNVTYEIPGIHAMYKIDLPPGVGNHTPGFAEVISQKYMGVIEQAAKSKEAHEKTIISSKSLASVAVDFLDDPKFRKEVITLFNKK